jgi:hypothetical protein
MHLPGHFFIPTALPTLEGALGVGAKNTVDRTRIEALFGKGTVNHLDGFATNQTPAGICAPKQYFAYTKRSSRMAVHQSDPDPPDRQMLMQRVDSRLHVEDNVASLFLPILAARHWHRS